MQSSLARCALLVLVAALLPLAHASPFWGNATDHGGFLEVLRGNATDHGGFSEATSADPEFALDFYYPEPYLSSPARARRLAWYNFDFLPGIPNLQKFSENLGKWVKEAVEMIKSAVSFVFDQVKKIFNGAKKFLRDGMKVVRAAWDASRAFASQLTGVFEMFEPIAKYFRKAGGMVLLVLKEPSKLSMLADVVMGLLNCTDEALQIGSVISKVSGFMNQIKDVFSQTLGKIVGGRRLAEQRLLEDEEQGGFLQLLDGLDFASLNHTFHVMAQEAVNVFTTLVDIEGVLRPLAEAVMEAWRKARGSRRLGIKMPNVVSDLDMPDMPEVPEVNYTDVQADQLKYEDAILQIVPAWMDLENLVLRICDGIGGAKSAVDNLKCRVLGTGDDLKPPGERHGEDCWDQCDKKAGFCDWCGKAENGTTGGGDACCRAGEKDSPEECHAAEHTMEFYHECVTPGTLTLPHRGENCWENCENMAGYCDWCGEGNACCRRGHAGDPAECEGVVFTSGKHHECVIALNQIKVGFGMFHSLPGMGYVQHLVTGCTASAENNTALNENGTAAHCPVAALSAAVRVSLAENAGIIGWFFAVMELTLQNPSIGRIVLAVPFFLIGTLLNFFGFRFMGITYFVKGFEGGVVMSSIFLTLATIKYEVCRGTLFDHCEPSAIFGFVLLCGILCGALLLWLRKTIEVLFGYSTGASIATILYIMKFYKDIWDGILAQDRADPAFQGLAVAAVSGGIAGAIIVKIFRKPMWIVGTSFAGGFLMVFSCNMAFGSSVDIAKEAAVGWAVISGLGVSVQYYFFIHPLPCCQACLPDSDDEDEKKPLVGLE